MAEKIAEKFENAMKTGFISALILIVLEKNPSYGYIIGKEIEKRTLGIWDPPSSTIYTVLKYMTEKKLIAFTEKQVEGRNRKIYEVMMKLHYRSQCINIGSLMKELERDESLCIEDFRFYLKRLSL